MATEIATKQPWQMTVDYYNEHEHPSSKKPIEEIREDLIREMERRRRDEPDNLPHELRQNFNPKKYFAKWSEPDLRDWHSGIVAGAYTHKKLVEKALKEGKLVPSKVLEEYPELAKPKPEKPSPGVKTGYSVSDYNKDMARSEKVYQEVLGRTGSHKEAFKAENEIATNALRQYEVANPIKVTRGKPKLTFVPAKATKQSDRAIAIDRSLLAKQVVSVDDPRWLRHPNRFDVRGIDTPGRGWIVKGVAYADRGKQRLSRKHHRGWKKVRFG